MSSSLLFRAKLLVWAFCLFAILPNSAFAQLAGTYSIPNDFTTFSEAIDSLVAVGVSDSVIFEVAPGSYPEKIVIPEIQGTSSTNRIKFVSSDSTNKALVSPPSNISYSSILHLDGADFVTFEKIRFKTQTGTNQKNGITLSNGANKNIIKQCQISSANPYPNLENGILCEGTTQGISHSDNLFINNEIYFTDNGIKIANSTYYGFRNKILNNKILLFKKIGIQLEKQTDFVISNNEIFDSYSSNIEDVIGISVFNDSKGEISANKVNNLTSTGGSVYGFFIDSSILLINNTFQSFTNLGETFGIFIPGNSPKIYFNTIRINAGNSAEETACLKTESNSLKVKNNIFINKSTGSNSYVIAFKNIDKNAYFDYNSYYFASNTFAKTSTNGLNQFATLEAWNEIFTFDSNSIIYLPLFYSQNNSHINNSTFSPLDGLGTPISDVPLDFDGNQRDLVNPDIGADEFIGAPPYHDVGIFGEIYSTNFSSLPNDSTTWKVPIKNFTINTETFFFILELDGTAFYQIITLNASESKIIEFTVLNPPQGHYSLNFKLNLSNDENFLNDSQEVEFNTFSNNYDVPFFDNFYSFDRTKWDTKSNGSFYTSTFYPNNPSPPTSLTLYKNGFDIVATYPIDLSIINSAELSFHYLTQSSEFFVEYLNAFGRWTKLELPTKNHSSYYRKVEFTLPQDAHHNFFQFRFIAKRISSVQYTFIDDFRVEAPNTYNFFSTIDKSEDSLYKGTSDTFFVEITNQGFTYDSYKIETTQKLSNQVLLNGIPITNTPQLIPQGKLNLEWVFTATNNTPATFHKDSLIITSNGDSTVFEKFEVENLVPYLLGGSSQFGYAWYKSLSGSIPYTFFDISTIGNVLPINKADDTTTVNLPWDFRFYLEDFSSLVFNSDGYVTFKDVLYPHENNKYIAPFGSNDFAFFQNQTQFFSYYDSQNDRMILQWEKLGNYYNLSETFTFQLILKPNGEFDINLKDTYEKNDFDGGIGFGYDVPYVMDEHNEVKYFENNTSLNFWIDSPPLIEHLPNFNTKAFLNPINVKAQILEEGNLVSVDLFWRNDSTSNFSQIPMLNTTDYFFEAQIPQQANGTTIQYYIQAQDDSLDISYHPKTAPTDFHTFFVGEILPITNLVNHANLHKYIRLLWENPVFTTSANFINSFSYTDEQTTAFGFEGTEGKLAIKFSIPSISALKSIDLNFIENSNQKFSLNLYSVSKSGLPECKIYEFVENEKVFDGNKVSFILAEGVSFEKGEFFVVVTQETESSINLSVDETNEIPFNTIFVSPLTEDNWVSAESLKIGIIPSIKINYEIGLEGKKLEQILIASDREFTRKQFVNSINFESLVKGKDGVKTVDLEKFLLRKNSLKHKNQNQILGSEFYNYRIYRSTNPNDLISPDSTKIIGETLDNYGYSVFIDSSTTLGTEYFYAVSVIYQDTLSGIISESTLSSIVPATSLNLNKPHWPNNLQAQVLPTQVQLTWEDPTTNFDSESTPLTDLAFIKIYRKQNYPTTSNLSYTLIDSVLPGVETWSDFSPPLFSVSYHTTGVDSSGNEDIYARNQVTVLNPYQASINSYGFTNLVFSDSLESDSNWTFVNSDSLVGWAIDATPDSVGNQPVPLTGTKCLNYNNGVDFNSSTINYGTATSPKISVENASNPFLTFWSLVKTDFYDERFVEISSDSFATTLYSIKLTGYNNPWRPEIFPLGDISDDIQIRFRFNTKDSLYNDFAGWFIDNIGIFGIADHKPPILIEATKLENTDDFSTFRKVQLKVKDPSNLDFVKLHYKFGNATNFTEVLMNSTDGVNFIDSIPPPPTVSDTKISYYFSAKDNSVINNTAFSPYNFLVEPNINVYGYDVGLTSPDSLKADSFSGMIKTEWKSLEDSIVVTPQILKKAVSKTDFLQKQTSKAKLKTAVLNETNLTYPVVSYNLYKLQGFVQNAKEVISNGTKIYTGLNLLFEDTNVVSPNSYSYTVSATYDLDGNFVESEPTEVVVSVPTILAQPEIFISSDSVAFENQTLTLGEALTDTVYIVNFGNPNLEISELNFSGTNNFFAPIQASTTINSGDTLALEINFTTNTSGTFSDSLQIVSNDPLNDTLVVNLSAEVTVVNSDEKLNQIPTEFTLSQNYPNPFNPTTKIKFGIPEKTFTKLEIFNVLGQSVKTLVSDELEPSFYEFQWNGTNGSGKSVSSGVYFYRLEAGNFVETKKMLFLK